MKLLLLSRYGSNGASSRVRYLQYLPFFKNNGVDIEVEPLFSNAYLDALYDGRSRVRETLLGYKRRMKVLLKIRQFDVIIVEKEFFPFLPALAELILPKIGVPYIVDYDDALFHRYDKHSNSVIRVLLGNKIDTVMRNADLVVTGNLYLAERAHAAGAKQIEIVPSVVDTDRYIPIIKSDVKPLVVGWMGTPKTSRYLLPFIPVFQRLNATMGVRFVAVGARAIEFEGSIVDVLPWSEATEVKSIQNFDIGIMPLDDTEWERGKCGYKLIQYMACGLPVVASPVGVNTEIVKDGVNGYLALSKEDWEDRLIKLCVSAEKRKNFGKIGREIAEKNYSIKAQQDRLLMAIKQVAAV